MCEEVSSDLGLKCPHCGYVRTADLERYISYHGMNGGAVAIVCGECERPFLASEEVTRRWRSTRIVQEAGRLPGEGQKERVKR